MNLSGTVIGGKVAYFKNLRRRASDEGRNVLFFGLAHMTYDEYKQRALDGNLAYVPNWIAGLVGNSAEIGRTAIVLELPPFTPAAVLASDKIDSAQVTADQILSHTIAKIRKQFVQDGAALANGWSLIGTDLRYQFSWADNDLVLSKGSYRHSIHNVDFVYNTDMTAEETWTQSFMQHYDYYWYLIGRTDSTSGFDRMVSAFCQRATTDPTSMGNKQGIFAQAAQLCRQLYAQVPLEVARAIILHLISVETARLDGMPNPTVYEAVKYGVAEQLTNLGLLGNIFSPTVKARNMVVVIGNDHVETVKRFVAANTAHVACDALVEGTHSGGESRATHIQSVLGQVIQLT